jgi:hypothetical protein
MLCTSIFWNERVKVNVRDDRFFFFVDGWRATFLVRTSYRRVKMGCLPRDLKNRRPRLLPITLATPPYYTMVTKQYAIAHFYNPCA